MITLQVTPRTEVGRRAKKLLDEGNMPGVVYGPTHDAQAVTVSLADFTKILRDEGETSVIELSGVGSPFQVLIHDVYRDPVTNVPHHADFYAIKKGAKVTVSVPLSFVGESPAVKQGANLVKVLHELEVESDPAKLPHEIEVDIAGLAEVGDQIHVKDLALPSGVESTHEDDEVVALIQEVKEEEEETTEAPDMDAIEVEQKGKEDEEESEDKE